ncbi:F-box/WD repeat-containing protein 2-like [Zootermopsis nevadensis]|uniref:F-box/WD repeat-containing protein 2 n=1 Tax=Zootermopsis nevadensis TaxID=136037 RepID=A0A067QZW7_ZOONE|nr:F-box/WD repeat-containing protein 2-like [Zootermopsis nevadensis]KDR10691.1 F-box/WD repeat-containing protein 2 [Zootermopsis nevadensis]
METLPTELQEILCSHLDGDSLLRACSVSPQWNRIISSLQPVWRYLCLHLGTSSVNYIADNWKTLYITCRRLLQHLKKGSAFKHRNFIPENFHASVIRGLVYGNGYLFAGIHNLVQVWRVSDLQYVAKFQVPYKLSCLTASPDGQVLGVGCHNGAITTWQLFYEKKICTEPLMKYHRHAGYITAMDISTELDLLCSGGSDRTTRVWNLFSGVLLWTATMNSSVSQIIMMPHYILLLADEVSIQRFSWLTQGGRLEATGPSILTGASMRRFLIHDRKLVYVRNGGAIVILDWCTGETLHQLSLGCTDIDLVAVGAKFMLAALWDNFCRKQELVIIDLSSGSVVGSYPMPYCRPEYVVAGETAWLSGLAYWKPETLVIATSNAFQATHCFYLVTWRCM